MEIICQKCFHALSRVTKIIGKTSCSVSSEETILVRLLQALNLFEYPPDHHKRQAMQRMGKRAEAAAEKTASMAISSFQSVEASAIERELSKLKTLLREKPDLLFRLESYLEDDILEAMLNGNFATQESPAQKKAKMEQKLPQKWKKWEDLLQDKDVLDQLYLKLFPENKNLPAASNETTTPMQGVIQTCEPEQATVPPEVEEEVEEEGEEKADESEHEEQENEEGENEEEKEEEKESNEASHKHKLQRICFKLLTHQSHPLPTKWYVIETVKTFIEACENHAKDNSSVFEGFEPTIFHKGFFENTKNEQGSNHVSTPFDKNEPKTHIDLGKHEAVKILDPYNPETPITYEEDGMTKEVLGIKEAFEKKGVETPKITPQKWKIEGLMEKKQTRFRAGSSAGSSKSTVVSGTSMGTRTAGVEQRINSAAIVRRRINAKRTSANKEDS